MIQENIGNLAIRTLPSIPDSCQIRFGDRILGASVKKIDIPEETPAKCKLYSLLFSKKIKLKEYDASFLFLCNQLNVLPADLEIKYENNHPVFSILEYRDILKLKKLTEKEGSYLLETKIHKITAHLETQEDFSQFKSNFLERILQNQKIYALKMMYDEGIELFLDEEEINNSSIHVNKNITLHQHPVFSWFNDLIANAPKYSTKKLAELHKDEYILVEKEEDVSILKQYGFSNVNSITNVSRQNIIKQANGEKIISLIDMSGKESEKYVWFKDLFLKEAINKNQHSVYLDESLRNTLIERGINSIACFMGVSMLPDKKKYTLDLIKLKERRG